MRRDDRPAPAPWRAGLAHIAAGLRAEPLWDLGGFCWSDVPAGAGLRSAAGVLVPLAVGLAAGHLRDGAYAALGALPAGFVAFQGVSRGRVAAVVLAALGMAAATFAGAAAAAAAPWLLVPLVAGSAYAAGLLSALGPRFGAAALQWPTAMLVATTLPLAPGPALARAALVLAGGLGQGALVVASWAVGPGAGERAAVAAAYRNLAFHAAGLAAGRHGPPPAAAFPGSLPLRDPNPLLRGPVRVHLLQLLDLAERIRVTLAAADRAPETGGAPRAEAAGDANALAQAAAALRGVAAALQERAAARRQAAALACGQPAPASGASWAAAALLGHVRAALVCVRALDDMEVGPAPAAGPRPPGVGLTLRSAAGPGSEAGRHAFRLAAAGGIAEAVALAARLPHGYWVPMTCLIVLQPGYASTLRRGLQRAAAVALGAGLGLATALLVPLGPRAFLPGIGLSLAVAYAVWGVNYFLYALFLTDLVVVLLALLGLPPLPAALARLEGTAMGAALALAAYAAWPTWERGAAGEKIARLLEEQGRYAGLALAAYAEPRTPDGRARLRAAQIQARRSRVDAEGSADRLADEGDAAAHGPRAAEAASILAAVRRFASGALTVGAAVEGGRACPPFLAGGTAEFAAAIRATMNGLAAAVRAGEAPGVLPDLRRLHAARIAAPAEAAPDGVLVAAADAMVDGADSIREWLARPRDRYG